LGVFNGSAPITATIPLANSTIGLLSASAQTIAGQKTFSDNAIFSTYITVSGTTTASVFSGQIEAQGGGFSNYGFKGNLQGNADSATVANHVSQALSATMGDSNNPISLITGSPATYNGSAAKTIHIPYASDSSAGIVSTGEQTFGGLKYFNDGLVASGNILPDSTASIDIGTSSNPFNAIYVTSIHGNADTATTANHFSGRLNVTNNATGIDLTQATGWGNGFTGSQTLSLNVFKPTDGSTVGGIGFVPAPGASDSYHFLQGNGQWGSIAVNGGLTISNTSNVTTIGHYQPVSTTSGT